MAMKNSSAEIVNMNDARARRLGQKYNSDDFRHAGAHLATVRESLGVTLSEASAKTHIKEAHLAAIEEIDLSRLPPRPYVIGFVKSYAEFLELEAAPIVERFKLDAEYNAPPAVAVEKFEAAADAASETGGNELSLWAIAGILLFFIWCAWQIMRPHDVTPIGEAEGRANALRLADPILAPNGNEILEAQILEQVDPVYPIACAAGAGGVETVQLTFNISASGRVVGERVTRSSNSCFDNSALNALRRWRFEPQKVDGEPRSAYDQHIQMRFDRPK